MERWSCPKNPFEGASRRATRKRDSTARGGSGASGQGRRDRVKTEFAAMRQYPRALRLASELADLRAADADRIPLRAKRGRSPARRRVAPPTQKNTPADGGVCVGGATRNRTGDEGFADLCLTAWLWRRMGKLPGVADYWALNRGSSRKRTRSVRRENRNARGL